MVSGLVVIKITSALILKTVVLWVARPRVSEVLTDFALVSVIGKNSNTSVIEFKVAVKLLPDFCYTFDHL